MPFITVACFIAGFAMLFFGCAKWHDTQKKVDEKQRIELKTAELTLKKMSEAEKRIKDIRETAEQLQSNIGTSYKRIPSAAVPKSGIIENQDSTTKASDVSKTSEATHKQMLKKYRQVLDETAKAIARCLSDSYTIMSDMRIGSTDYIFEIKYLFSPNPSNLSMWKEIPHRLRTLEKAHTERTERKVKAVLLLVAPESQVETVREIAGKSLAAQGVTASVLPESEIDDLSLEKVMGER